MAHAYSKTRKDPLQLIMTKLTPITRSGERLQSTCTNVFPDSGASLSIAGPQHQKLLGLSTDDLTPSSKQATAVGDHILTCYGLCKVQFVIGGNQCEQILYFCKNIQHIYLSRNGCIALNILPKCFPEPMANAVFNISAALPGMAQADPLPTPNVDSSGNARILPIKPLVLPYEPTEENVDRLKQFLLDQFASTAFNVTGEFPCMTGTPMRIHLKPDAKPRAVLKHIPTPFHIKEKYLEAINKAVERGIYEWVPPGEPTPWVHQQVVTSKKNGDVRLTLDLQYLNTQCENEPHPLPSPFHLACEVPPQTYKTVLDAVEGYHAVPLDADSKKLLTFITEFGMLRCGRGPMGYFATGHAYNKRFSHITKDVPRLKRMVDDNLLHDTTIAEHFWHVWDFLELCAQNGIVFNAKKFQFCARTILFAGLKITPSGIAPSDDMLKSIRDFPPPSDITAARSWFGLVNQVAWAYAIRPEMQPFRDLVKKNTKFQWSVTLQDLFDKAKAKIISMVKDGVQGFDTTRETCLQTDWSQVGLGYLLLQKYCDCSMLKAPVCCPEGWKLVFAGSRFTLPAESRYAPIEGEALGVSWSLDHARMFTIGCPNLTVVTDHKPLLGVFRDRALSSIANPKVLRLKEKTLRYRFAIQYSPGKWQKGPDAMSRNPVASILCQESPSKVDCDESDLLTNCETVLNIATTCAIDCINSSVYDGCTADTRDSRSNETMPTFQCHIADVRCKVLSLHDITLAGKSDPEYQALLLGIRSGFDNSKHDLAPDLRKYWEMIRQNRLSLFEDVILMDRRIVIPQSLRRSVIHNMHAAHQGCTGMTSRARKCIYWPALERDILNFRASCQRCNFIAPSQRKEPLVISPAPAWPFQQICLDYFELRGHRYLVVTDRYSGWISIYHFKHAATAAKLVATLWHLVTNYGIPEEISSDGGPQFESSDFKTFLTLTAAHHRLSSVAYPQSNGRAELAVKAAKRMLTDCTNPDGSIDNVRFARAILQYRNTPLPYINLSPAMILFHRELRDFTPTHPSNYKLHETWLLQAKERERVFANRNRQLCDTYNRTAHPLKPLTIGTGVYVQNPSTRKWDRSGRIIQALPNRQYKVVMDGSGRVTLRNRRFIRPNPLHAKQQTHFPAITPGPLQDPNTVDHPLSQPHTPDVPQPPSNTSTVDTPGNFSAQRSTLPLALRRLQNFNKPGLTEQQNI